MEKYGIVGQTRDDNIVRPLALHSPHLGPQTHTDYVMLIAFARQRLLHESTSKGHSTYIGHTGTAHCSIGPVALSSCTFQIHVKLSVHYCSVTK